MEETQAEPQVDATDQLPDDYYYDTAEFAADAQPDALQGDFCSLHRSLGFESTRRANLAFLDGGKTLAYAAGNLLHFVDVETRAQTTLPSLRGQGIGAVAVHPQLGHICVAECGKQPEVFIYECATTLPKTHTPPIL